MTQSWRTSFPLALESLDIADQEFFIVALVAIVLREVRTCQYFPARISFRHRKTLE